MLRCFAFSGGRLVELDTGEGEADARIETLRQAVWIDAENPTSEEDDLILTAVGVDIPDSEEMEEIETSSRLYEENGATFMTALFPAATETDTPMIEPISFVLSDKRLITVRFHAARAFQVLSARADRAPVHCPTGMHVASELLDIAVDRIADILEKAGKDVDGISKDIFRQAGEPVKAHDYRSILQRVAHKGDLVSMIRDSLGTLDRMFSFLVNLAGSTGADKETRARVKTLSRDARSLIDHAGFLSQKITFLLDATLGMISIEQSGIIKIFSVAAVIFLPPTLVASIYGMNFEIIPELGWRLGYPYALVLMVVSAIIPYVFFRKKGWL